MRGFPRAIQRYGEAEGIDAGYTVEKHVYEDDHDQLASYEDYKFWVKGGDTLMSIREVENYPRYSYADVTVHTVINHQENWW